MTRFQFVLLAVAVGLFMIRPTATPQPPTPQPPTPQPSPLQGLGAFSVDLPDDQLAALGKLMSSRTLNANGWDITLADDCVMRFNGNKILIDGGIKVRGKVWKVPVGTSVNSLAWDQGRVIIDLNGVPLDVVLE